MGTMGVRYLRSKVLRGHVPGGSVPRWVEFTGAPRLVMYQGGWMPRGYGVPGGGVPMGIRYPQGEPVPVSINKEGTKGMMYLQWGEPR